MIRELVRTFIEDVRAGASWHDIHADLWATYYTLKASGRNQPR